MPDSAPNTPIKLNKETQNLVDWCCALYDSGSHIEDEFWEAKLVQAISKLLNSGKEQNLTAALEYLSDYHPDGFEILLDYAENLSSTCQLDLDGQRWTASLVSAPFACWTRYQIPNRDLNPQQITLIKEALTTHVLAQNTQMALVPKLISLDQMPQSFSETLKWTRALGQGALIQTTPSITLNPEPENVSMLADSRHIVLVVVAPAHAPLFKWQEKIQFKREKLAPKWAKSVNPMVANLLTGCEFESILPDAYYVNLRACDKQVRPLNLKAAVNWLSTAMGKPPQQLRAVMAGFGQDKLQEYRISLTEKGQNQVLYGMLWPLFLNESVEHITSGVEDETLSTVDKIVQVLVQSGVTDVKRLPGLLAPEFCEDCGAPEFPNPLGELVHAELPDDVSQTTERFH